MHCPNATGAHSRITPIRLGDMSSACYLLRSSSGFVLVDTGKATRRQKLLSRLRDEGCTPENLHLIFLTHGDFDHSGNARHLRSHFDAPVAIHEADAPILRHADMFQSRRNAPPGHRDAVNGRFDFTPFSPDLTLRNGARLTPWGLDATVIHLPGHSGGSAGLLTAERDLFSGDVFVNGGTPQPTRIVDDQSAFAASLAFIADLDVRMVYPGHGRPFAYEELLCTRS